MFAHSNSPPLEGWRKFQRNFWRGGFIFKSF